MLQDTKYIMNHHLQHKSLGTLSSLDKNEVHYSVWTDISTEEYIFLSFTSNYYSSFDAHLVSM